MSAVDILAGLYDAFGRGDVPGVLGSMDPSIRWHEAEGNPYMPSGEAWVGPDAIVNNLFVKLVEEWDGFTVQPQTFHDAGDVVVVEARYTGTYKATGKPMDAQVCHVWTVKDGKVVKFQQYVDTAKLQDAMGAGAGH
jgi:ketosteroid isomerase-like protein